jgi:hypothetical protein
LLHAGLERHILPVRKPLCSLGARGTFMRGFVTAAHPLEAPASLAIPVMAACRLSAMRGGGNPWAN